MGKFGEKTSFPDNPSFPHFLVYEKSTSNVILLLIPFSFLAQNTLPVLQLSGDTLLCFIHPTWDLDMLYWSATFIIVAPGVSRASSTLSLSSIDKSTLFLLAIFYIDRWSMNETYKFKQPFSTLAFTAMHLITNFSRQTKATCILLKWP